jgi:hypothetical protein
MSEPVFPFYADGDESEAEVCYDCGRPLPDEGDPDVIRVLVTNSEGNVVSVCRRHWLMRTAPHALH